MKNKKALNIKRPTADRIISEVIERAKEINSSVFPKYMNFIKQIAVFGSYLTDKEKLGDVDIAVWIERREKYNGQNYINEIVKSVELHNKNIYTFDQLLFFPETIIYKTLRNNSKALSVHPSEDLEGLIDKYGTNYKIIYQMDGVV